MSELIEDLHREDFWARLAHRLDWFTPRDTVRDWQPYASWFTDGHLNVSYNDTSMITYRDAANLEPVHTYKWTTAIDTLVLGQAPTGISVFR